MDLKRLYAPVMSPRVLIMWSVEHLARKVRRLVKVPARRRTSGTPRWGHRAEQPDGSGPRVRRSFPANRSDRFLVLRASSTFVSRQAPLGPGDYPPVKLGRHWDRGHESGATVCSPATPASFAWAPGRPGSTAWELLDSKPPDTVSTPAGWTDSAAAPWPNAWPAWTSTTWWSAVWVWKYRSTRPCVAPTTGDSNACW